MLWKGFFENPETAGFRSLRTDTPGLMQQADLVEMNGAMVKGNRWAMIKDERSAWSFWSKRIRINKLMKPSRNTSYERWMSRYSFSKVKWKNFDSTLRDENFSISSCKVRTSSSLVHVQSWHQGSIGIKRWEFHGGVMFATRENPWKKKTQEQLPGGPRPIPGVPEQWLPPVMKEVQMSSWESLYWLVHKVRAIIKYHNFWWKLRDCKSIVCCCRWLHMRRSCLVFRRPLYHLEVWKYSKLACWAKHSNFVVLSLIDHRILQDKSRKYEYYVCVCFAQCLFGGETRHLFFCLESSRSLWSARCWSVADFTHPASEKWNVAGSWRLVARVATYSHAVSTNDFFIDNNRQIWESYVCNSCYSYNQTAIWPGLTTSKWEFLAARAFQPILNISITHVTVTHFWPEPASCFLARDASMASYMMLYLAQDPHFRGFICLLPNLPL